MAAVGSDRQFQALCDLLGLNDLAEDDRFNTNPHRVTNRMALAGRLAPAFSQQDADALMKEAIAVGIPLGRVKSVEEALSSGTGRAMTAEFALEGIPVRHVRQVAFRLHRKGSRTT